MGKIWPILNGNLTQKVPILNDQADMRPILNGNLSIHSIHLKPKKDPFPSKLCSHIPSRMNLSQTPGGSRDHVHRHGIIVMVYTGKGQCCVSILRSDNIPWRYVLQFAYQS